MVRIVSLLLVMLGVGPSWPDPRGNMHGVPSSGGGGVAWDVQTFTAGAGTYTWTKPSGVTFVRVIIFAPGMGGGSGGFGAVNSGGGGGGASGGYVSQTFLASQLGGTEHVILGPGGLGGNPVIALGGGNNGNVPASETSFGDPGENLIRIVPIGVGVKGNTGTGGTGGNTTISSYTTKVGLWAINGLNGGSGSTAATGSNSSTVTFNSTDSLWPVASAAGGGGGGGDGCAGPAFCSGGTSIGPSTSGFQVQYFTPTAGGVTESHKGDDGANGGWGKLTTVGTTLAYGGMGGGGGAGGRTAGADGGAGGNGGNCGGGGGGGGGSLSGSTLGSGAGGNGGDSCAIVISW